ncbi:MAG: DUF3047 domain-containing protein [Desulfurivibrionaceae bacterium]
MARFSAVILFVAAIIYGPHMEAGEHLITVGDFSNLQDSKSLPENWEPLHFEDIERHTDYKPVRTENGHVIRAESQNSSSGLIRKVRIDPVKYPIVEWNWKISNVYEKGDARKKAGDDYPARLYITFAYEPDKMGFFQKLKFKTVKIIYGEYPPTSTLNYIWANQVETGSILANPYTDKVKMIAVESGSNKANQWIRERRNILEDYREIYGEDPPEITGVAIMTDSDNTGEEATAWYGDIIFKSGKNSSPDEE